MAEQSKGFDINNFINTTIGGGISAWNSYQNQKAEAARADQAQQNAQAALNSANLANTLAKNKTTLIAIGGVVAVLIAFIMFRR